MTLIRPGASWDLWLDEQCDLTLEFQQTHDGRVPLRGGAVKLKLKLLHQPPHGGVLPPHHRQRLLSRGWRHFPLVSVFTLQSRR